VEDEVLIRLALADYLQECGFKVFEAANAAEAIEILRSDQAAIDLVFTDVNLPGEVNGFGLARWIRTDGPSLPVILTSGDSKMAIAAKELCEHHSFVSKPYDLAAVVGHMRSSIDARKNTS
jgi:DNA-binding NtrC family response regulator